MAFISMFIIGLFLIMFCFGAFLLFLSLILFLINRHRRKKGMNPGRVMNVVKILCLVFGCMNVAPFVFVCLFTLLAEPVSMAADIVWVNVRQVFMPNQTAVLWTYETEESEEDEEKEEQPGQVLEYEGQEYIALPYYAGEGVNYSKPKASVEYGTRKVGQTDGESETGMDGKFVCEVENRTDFSLICIGEYRNFVFDRKVEPYDLYCLRTQYDEFLQTEYKEAEYYLEWTDGTHHFNITKPGFGLADLGITSEFLLTLKDGQGQELKSSEDESYDLIMTSTDGIFTDAECANIKKEKKVWYCSKWYDTGNGYPLPEEGQHFMDELNENP